MKFDHRWAATVLFVAVAFSGNLSVASTTYQFSGTINGIYDRNDNLAVIGANNVYPVGISAGMPFSVSMSLNGDLGALSGSIDFDLGGVYWGQMSISGAASVCDSNSCTRYGDYNDPLRPRMNDVTLSNQTAAVTTNLPLSDLGLEGNILYAWIYLNLAPNTNKPAITTALSDLPISSISFYLDSSYAGSKFFDCPACVEGYYEEYFSQGWGLDATASALTTTVPIPATVWLFGSGLAGLIGFVRRKARLA